MTTYFRLLIRSCTIDIHFDAIVAQPVLNRYFTRFLQPLVVLEIITSNGISPLHNCWEHQRLYNWYNADCTTSPQGVGGYSPLRYIPPRDLDFVCCVACCGARQPYPVRISHSSRSIRRPTLPHVEFDAENVSKTKDVSLSGQRSLPTYVVRRECAEISVLCSDASALRLLVKGTESRSQDGHIREIRQRTPHIARAQGSSSS